MSNATRRFQEDTHALCVLALARYFVSGVSVILPTQKKQCLGEIQLSIVSFSNTHSSEPPLKDFPNTKNTKERNLSMKDEIPKCTF